MSDLTEEFGAANLRILELEEERNLLQMQARLMTNVLTSAEMKLVDKHCEWPSFKCAFNAVMNSRSIPPARQ